MEPNAERPPSGKRDLPAIPGCEKVSISITPADWAYLGVRAERARVRGDGHATRSGQIRVALAESRKLRHDVKTVVNALALLAEVARLEANQAEAAGKADAVAGLAGLLAYVRQHEGELRAAMRELLELAEGGEQTGQVAALVERVGGG